MNCAQIKDPVSHMCFAGTMVASCLSLTQEVAGSSPFIVMLYNCNVSVAITNKLCLVGITSTVKRCNTEEKINYYYY